MARVTGTVGDATAGERLDRIVALLTGLSRSDVARLVAEGAVAVDGVAETTRSRRVESGETLDIEVPEPSEPGVTPDPDVTFGVVHVDDHIVVVDKPAGLVVHPGAGHAGRTLVHGLVARFPEIAGVGDPGRPGIVHRLDRPTSGLLIVARTPSAHETLSAMMADHVVERTYLGVATGHLADDEGVVDAPIGRSSRQPTKMTVSASGRPARTRYRVLRRASQPLRCTVVELDLETGRTHQIRVHLGAIGHPLVGDRAYGARDDALGRVALHAHRLRFAHPHDGTPCAFVAPVPADLAALIATLGD